MRLIDGLDVSPFMKAHELTDTKRNADKLGIDIPEWFRTTGLKGALLPQRSVVRRVEPDDTDAHVPWHCDANFVGYGGTVHTLWIPLVDIDDATPGLEFAEHNLTREQVASKWRQVGADERQRIALDDDGLHRLIGSYKVIAPRLTVGQALLFHQFEIHRTQVMADHPTRISIDIRFTPRTP